MVKKNRTIKRIILGGVALAIAFVVIVIVNLIIFEKKASEVSLGQPIEDFEGNNYALLVVDIQEGTTGEVSMIPFFKENSDELIKNVNQIANSYSANNVPVIYVRNEISDPLINMLNDSYAKGSIGAQFDKRLNIVSNLFVVKNRNDAFINTNLTQILNVHKISELHVVGLDAAYCINATVAAAKNRNYRVNLIYEATLSESKAAKDSMMTIFNDRGIGVIKMDRL